MKRVCVLLAMALFFVMVNVFLFRSVTCRLVNNYGTKGQMRMVDVGKYLPFDSASDLARTGSALKFSAEEDLPVLDGAAALVPVYASVIENCYPEGTVTYEGGSFSDDNKYGENFAVDSAMQFHNTIRGFNALLDGTVDLFFTAHPSEEQLQEAKERGVALKIVPVGKEAFVFFVNKKNPVEELSIDQIRGIYRGEINNWKEVGGPNKRINQVTRVKNSGSQTMMEKFMENDMLTKRHPLAIFGASIGYSFRFYLSGMIADDNVKMLAINGVYPNAENIRNGSYPISANFYVVYREDEENPNVQKLVDWLLTQEGQTMIEACGYVGLK